MALTAGIGGSGSGRRRRGRAKRGALSEINVTPLVDVMLVLLIIFMISAPLLTAGVEVELPKTEASAMQATDEPLTVTVRKDGTIFVMEDAATYDQLGPRLKAMTQGDVDRPIFLRGDAATPYEAMARVMAKLQVTGFTHINLITDTGSGDDAATPVTPAAAEPPTQ
ncbi:MAG: biopolymer transporter ExbD [Rhodospirillaceae bacterium]|nr:biopolymer transporter ExbD [Rhodospirillaceae bacterium]